MNILKNMDSEFDIFFISYNESNCEENWLNVLLYHPTAKRIHGVKGIDRAHLICDQLCQTEYFWTIDGDNFLYKKLDFEPNCDLHLFLIYDPIFNELTRLGCVKLWKKGKIIHTDMSKGDFCLNATEFKNSESIVFSECRYTNTPYDAWKTAFRHCVKLSSSILKDRPNAQNLDHYLEKWKTSNQSKIKNSEWCYKGYIDALDFAAKYQNDFEVLNQINDYDQLRKIYNEYRLRM